MYLNESDTVHFQPENSNLDRAVAVTFLRQPLFAGPSSDPFSITPSQLNLSSMTHRPVPVDASIDVVIPAFNEEASLPLVLAALPQPPVRRVVVADNNSTDKTAQLGRQGGAVVVPAPIPGYGSACLAALDHVRRHDPPDIVVFIDADYSDHPEELPRVVAPILADRADVVIGSRVLGHREPGALLPQARAGNLVACTLIRLLYRHRYTDLGPFRAIRWAAFEQLNMSDPNFGWTAEMQVKALRAGLRVTEVPVSYRKRIGVSKITGTVKGTILAGYKILWTVFRYSLQRNQ